MSAMEIEGKSVEEAIEAACQRLNLPADQLEIEVISHGSSGIFGIGTRNAKILVTAKESGDETSLREAKEILENILSHIQVPTTVEATWEEDRIKLDVTSNGSGLLIGKRGQTLHSLQYIVNKIYNRQASKKSHIIVDTENYRDRRRQALTEVALNLGDRAKKSGKPASSSPLSAYDRRIIHLALKDDRQVRTKSKGEGTLRKVVVFPVKKDHHGEKQTTAPDSSTQPPSEPGSPGGA
ncbi:MAG: protein jag [Deltaproteobacteria bacterium]|nr:MAG: protein jag [Deltaproteobacteria bacterium]